MSFQIFQWFFKFFSGVWKPNSKSHLSAAWCLMLTPRHEPLGWLATTVFDWRKNKCLEKSWCLSHPTSPICWLNYLRRQFVYNLFFLFTVIRPLFVSLIVILLSVFCFLFCQAWFCRIDILLNLLHHDSKNLNELSKYEWVFKIWVSFNIWVSFQNFSELSNFEWVLKLWISFLSLIWLKFWNFEALI